MAFARYGYSVGCTTSFAVGSLLIGPGPPKVFVVGLLPNLGCEELRSPPVGPPGKPATGDEVSKPPSCADVYICGGTLEEIEVSGRPVAYPLLTPRPPWDAR
jgi:hypothetical protein